MEIRYGAENVWIPADDGCALDAMYLRAEPDENSPQDQDNPELGPTVIMFNPNAGYYEYAIELQDHWIEFYRSNGLNILLWNYRGYARSKGRPSPANILSDGEAVVRFLRSKGTGRVILHGESLGGAVAAHVAKKAGCDFLFSDRTFSDLDAVAEYSVGAFAAAAMKQVTGWAINTTQEFLGAQCYKVVSSDPDDAIVGEVASLKNGIARAVVSVLCTTEV